MSPGGLLDERQVIRRIKRDRWDQAQAHEQLRTQLDGLRQSLRHYRLLVDAVEEMRACQERCHRASTRQNRVARRKAERRVDELLGMLGAH